MAVPCQRWVCSVIRRGLMCGGGHASRGSAFWCVKPLVLGSHGCARSCRISAAWEWVAPRGPGVRMWKVRPRHIKMPSHSTLVRSVCTAPPVCPLVRTWMMHGSCLDPWSLRLGLGTGSVRVPLPSPWWRAIQMALPWLWVLRRLRMPLCCLPGRGGRRSASAALLSSPSSMVASVSCPSLWCCPPWPGASGAPWFGCLRYVEGVRA